MRRTGRRSAAVNPVMAREARRQAAGGSAWRPPDLSSVASVGTSVRGHDGAIREHTGDIAGRHSVRPRDLWMRPGWVVRTVDFWCPKISEFWKNKKMKSCKIHCKIQYTVRVARFEKKTRRCGNLRGEGMQKLLFLTRGRRRETTKKNDHFSSIFRRFFEKTAIQKATREKTAKN